MTTESLSVTIEGELLTVEIGTVAAPVGGSSGSGDVVGPASATDGRIAEFDGTTGKLIRHGSYTIAKLLAAAWARASHTGTQLAATISDFASAAIAAVTWSTLTGKPSTFDPSAHKTSHATGGSDALTASDIGAATAAHDHTGLYQPLATVLTNTTAAFTTAQETKLSGIETAADVTDAGNVGSAIDGATAKTTPVDADTIPLIDSAAANVLKKLSWANIKATAKAYFDTLYQAALVSGTNIKTVNSTSLLGSGDIAISASPGGSTTQLQYNNAGAFGGMSGTTWNDTTRAETRTGATITTSNPVQSFTQTWNAGAVAFTGWKINITNTASAAASKPFDVQVGGATVFSVRVDGALATNNYGLLYTGGYLVPTDTAFSNAANLRAGSIGFSTKMFFGADGATSGPGFIGSLNETGGLAFLNSTNTAYAPLAVSTLAIYGTGTAVTSRVLLEVPAGGILEQRRGKATQEKRLYRSYNDASNYSRLAQRFNTTTAVIHAEGAGTGSDGSVAFNDAALATNATVGFLMIPSCAGTPSGTPDDIPTGQIPLVWDSTNLKLYAYTGGAWKASAAFT